MTLTLYGNPQSSYVRTARITCEEKGVPYALEAISPKATLERGLHPFRKIPAMTHGEFRLFETSAICLYIDECFEGPALQPTEPQLLAEMEQWISAYNDTVYDAMGRRFVLSQLFPKTTDGQPDRGIVDPAIAQMRDQLAVYDQHLRDRSYMVGDSLTLADLFLPTILYYVARLPDGPGLLAAAPNVQRVIGTLEQRESFRKTRPQMGEGENRASAA